MPNKENLLWPDVIEETDHQKILLQHTMILTRDEFNNSFGRMAQVLIERGTLDISDTNEVRKYIFEIEITD